MRAKLGFQGAAEGDRELATGWLDLLEEQNVDFTLAWRRLADAAAGDAKSLDALFRDAHALGAWIDRWRRRAAQEPIEPEARKDAMNRVNPLYIPRNHRVEEALAAASDRADLRLFERLLDAIANPFEERPELE